jgi:hypothetical protein
MLLKYVSAVSGHQFFNFRISDFSMRLTSASWSRPDSRNCSWFANSLLQQPDHIGRRLQARQAASSLSSRGLNADN